MASATATTTITSTTTTSNTNSPLLKNQQQQNLTTTPIEGIISPPKLINSQQLTTASIPLDPAPRKMSPSINNALNVLFFKNLLIR